MKRELDYRADTRRERPAKDILSKLVNAEIDNYPRLMLAYILYTLADVELDGDPIWGNCTDQHGLRLLPIKFTPPVR